MKKTASTVALSFMIAGSIAAQGMKVLELQVGYLSPKDTKAGAIFGLNYGVSVDEKMDLSLGLSYFHKGYSKTTEVSEGYETGAGSGVKTVQQPLEYSTTLLPLMANVTVHFPFQQPWGFHAGGSLGYEFLFDTYTNHATNTSEKIRFSGFGWMLRVGMEASIGSRSFFQRGGLLQQLQGQGE